MVRYVYWYSNFKICKVILKEVNDLIRRFLVYFMIYKI